MRIVAGTFRSRQLIAPRGTATRPTSDRLRETLLNVLSARIGNARFADLYAGSGAVGIEALSRGAVHCTFVEDAPAAATAIRANLAALGITTGFSLESRSVKRALEHLAPFAPRFDLIFLDPPYEAVADYAGTLGLLATHAAVLLSPGALVVAEHARRTPLSSQIGQLARTRVLEQGDAALSFYTLAPQSAE